MKRKLVQIIPAPAGVKAVFREGGQLIRQRMHAIGLYSNGQTGCLVLDSASGMLDDVAEMDNLVEVEVPR